MMENNPIKKMANSVLRGRKQAIFDRKIMHPEREWFLGIFVGLSFLIFGGTWSVNTYLDFSNVTVTGSADTGQKVAYKAALMETALTDISDRNNIYEGLKSSLIGRNIGREIAPETSVLEEGLPIIVDEGTVGSSTTDGAVQAGEQTF